MEAEQQIEQMCFDDEYAGIHPPAIGVDHHFETKVGLMNCLMKHVSLQMNHLTWCNNWMKERYIDSSNLL